MSHLYLTNDGPIYPCKVLGIVDKWMLKIETDNGQVLTVPYYNVVNA